jgi:integrase
MPSVQRGQVYRLAGGSWAYRYRDEHKRRRQRGGFSTRSEALEALDDALKTARNPERADRRDWTVTELVDRYLAQHQASPATIARLKAMTKKATVAFGDVRLRELLPDEIGAWAKRIPEGHRHDAMVPFRQVLNAAVRWKLIEENPAKLVPNPLPRRAEIRPFESWEEIEALAEELGPWGVIPIFAAGTGLRPEEWLALSRRDIDREAVTVRRTLSGGELHELREDEPFTEARTAAPARPRRSPSPPPTS